MEEKDIFRLLKKLKPVFGESVPWSLTGSVNLKVQELDVTPSDLDITTNLEGLELVRTKLEKYVKKDEFKEDIQAHAIICVIDGFEVDISYNLNEKVNLFHEIKFIKWNRLKIPVLPLEKAKDFYKLKGRKDKVELIERNLKQRT